MPNPAISREDVHLHAEACSEAGEAYQPIALRLMRGQRRLSKFIEANAAQLGHQESEVALHMTSVSLRVFEKMGGRMSKVTTRDLDLASARVSAASDQILPLDKGLPERVRLIEWRAQPHLLDEILWALYERDEQEKKEGEVDLAPERAGFVFLTMWVLVEAMDMNWMPPAVIEG